MTEPIPVILHTDIGTDIDDTWALGMMLLRKELKPLLILTDTGDTVNRAKICARMLENARRTEVEVAAGIPGAPSKCPIHQMEWIKDYRLSDYPGKYHADGVSRLIEVVMASPKAVTLISIGPTPSLAEALRKAPEIAPKIDFVGMFGSIRIGYNGSPAVSAEYNVLADVPSCQTVFRAPWHSAAITPLDTCGLVRLTGKLYEKMEQSRLPVTRDIIENYHVWSVSQKRSVPPAESTVLYDTVAVHMAYSRKFLRMEKLKLSVTEKGMTVEDPAGGIPFDTATSWSDLDAYHRYLTDILNPGLR